MIKNRCDRGYRWEVVLVLPEPPGGITWEVVLVLPEPPRGFTWEVVLVYLSLIEVLRGM